MWFWMSLLLNSVNFTSLIIQIIKKVFQHNLLNPSFAELPALKSLALQSFSNIFPNGISGIYYCWLLQTTSMLL